MRIPGTRRNSLGPEWCLSEWTRGPTRPLNDRPSQKSPLLMALGPPSSTLHPTKKEGDARSRHKKELPLARMVSGRMDQGSKNTPK